MRSSKCTLFMFLITGATLLTYYTSSAYPINKYNKKLTDKFHKHLLEGIMRLNVTEYVIIGQRRMNNGLVEPFWSGGSTESNQPERTTDGLLKIVALTSDMLELSHADSPNIMEDVAASEPLLTSPETEKHEIEKQPHAEIMFPERESKPAMPVSAALIRIKPEQVNNEKNSIHEKLVQEYPNVSVPKEVDIEIHFYPDYNEETFQHSTLNQTESVEASYKATHILFLGLLLIYAVVVTILQAVQCCTHCCTASSNKAKILSSHSDLTV